MTTTAFEDRLVSDPTGAAWTTPSEEFSYLTALAAEYDTVAFDIAGYSVSGRPIYLVRVGHPVAPTRAEAMEKPCVLIAASMHGEEPAPRDGCLTYIRTLASATGGAAEYLEGVTWLFVPSQNPDGVVATSRQNANGVNLNSDHIKLTQPETRALHRVIRDFKPEVVVDIHESGSSNHVQYRGSVFDAVHPALRSLGAHMCVNYMIPLANSLSWTHEYFGGGENPNILRNVAGLRGAVSFIIETGQGVVFTRADRLQNVVLMLPAMLDFCIDKQADISAAVALAKIEKTAEGAAGVAEYQTPDLVIDPPPLGYSLTEQEVEALAIQREIFQFEMVAPGIVSMAQPLQPLIPCMVDAAINTLGIEGTRMFSGVPNPPLEALTVTDGVPSVDCNESAGTVHYITVAAGGPALMPEDVAQLIEYGVVV